MSKYKQTGRQTETEREKRGQSTSLVFPLNLWEIKENKERERFSGHFSSQKEAIQGYSHHQHSAPFILVVQWIINSCHGSCHFHIKRGTRERDLLICVDSSPAQWFRRAKNRDASTGPPAHSFACSLPLLTRSLALHCLLRLRAPLRTFARSPTHSLPSSWESEWLDVSKRPGFFPQWIHLLVRIAGAWIITIGSENAAPFIQRGHIFWWAGEIC